MTAMKTRHASLLSLTMLALLLPPAAASAATNTIWVGADADCGTDSLAVAINDASILAGDATVILVADSGQNYSDENLSVLNRNINITGGYAHCHDTTRGSGYTVISGAADGGSVLFVANSSTQRTLRLEQIELRGGSGGPSGYGGGLRISGNASVLLYNVRIQENQASSGGGIALLGDNSVRPSLALHQGTIVGGTDAAHGNTAQAGAGVFCRDANVLVSAVSVEYNQTPGFGGGLYLDNCLLQSSGTENAPTRILYNHAANGAGIFAGNGSSVSLSSYYNLDLIAVNDADDYGGGVLVSGAATQMHMIAGNINQNSAGTAGGGVVAINGAQFDADRGDDVPALCAQGLCSSMISNVATAGAAVYADSGGTVTLRRTAVTGPSNVVGIDSALYATGAGSALALDDALLTHLPATTSVLADAGASVNVDSSTVSGNAGLRDFLLNTADTSLNISNSIIWDPGAVAVNGPGTVTASNDNSHDPATLPGVGLDPGFVDPDHNNWHLRGDSINVDTYTPASYTPGVDIEGNARPYDLFPNHGGIFDRGAYELGDEIFADGFEPPG